MYINQPIKNYLKLLAGRQAVPGGGSAAALVAAAGTALYVMVAAYSEPTRKIQQAKRKLKKIQAAMEGIVDRDAVVFTKLQEAMKMPREVKQRTRLVQLGLRNAALAPLKLAGLCVAAMEAGAFLAEKGNKNLITDTGAAALFLESAFAGAALNVRINLKYLKQPGFVRSRIGQLQKLQRRMDTLKQRLARSVEQKVR